MKPKKGDVALLAEGVDRNPTDMNLTVELTVALLAEGVDRNIQTALDECIDVWSPSSRRAWIEIRYVSKVMIDPVVALLAEGVDRNPAIRTTSTLQSGRPPRGGRG